MRPVIRISPICAAHWASTATRPSSGGRPDRAEGGLRDALVDAVPDQHGQQQAHARVDGDERQAEQQGRAEAAQQPRRPYDSSGATARASSTAGVSVAGGSASTWARSSGVAGMPAKRGVPGLPVAGPQPGRDAALGVELGVQLVPYGVASGVVGLGQGGRAEVAG